MVHRPGQRRVTLVSSITDGMQEAAQKRSAAHKHQTAAKAVRQVKRRRAQSARMQSKKARAGVCVCKQSVGFVSYNYNSNSSTV